MTEGDKDKRIKRLMEEIGTLHRRLRKYEADGNEKLVHVLRSLGLQVRRHPIAELLEGRASAHAALRVSGHDDAGWEY
jgi:hypothetical protein